MTEFWNSTVTIILAIIGIAGLALIVSRQSNTSGVISAGASGVSQLLGAAEAPVTGATGNAYVSPTAPASFPSFSL